MTIVISKADRVENIGIPQAAPISYAGQRNRVRTHAPAEPQERSGDVLEPPGWLEQILIFAFRSVFFRRRTSARCDVRGFRHGPPAARTARDTMLSRTGAADVRAAHIAHPASARSFGATLAVPERGRVAARRPVASCCEPAATRRSPRPSPRAYRRPQGQSNSVYSRSVRVQCSAADKWQKGASHER